MPTKKNNTKYIETPEKLWSLFVEYKKEVKENPRIKIEYVGRDGDRVETPIERPLTIEGFKVFCYDHKDAGDIQGYWYNFNNSYNDYLTIVTRIKEVIRQDQLEGGMVGQYNANLTARMNGLKEQTESVSNHNISLLNIDVLSDENDTIKIESDEQKKLDK